PGVRARPMGHHLQFVRRDADHDGHDPRRPAGQDRRRRERSRDQAPRLEPRLRQRLRLFHQPRERQHHGPSDLPRPHHVSEPRRHMIAAWFFDRLRQWGDDKALVWNDSEASYAEVLRLGERWSDELARREVKAGQVVALIGSFSPNACAALLALVKIGAIAAPLTPIMRAQHDKFMEIAEVRLSIEFDDADQPIFRDHDRAVTNPLTKKLVERGNPGLVIFSSGSTGNPKGILHDLSLILEKFEKIRQKKTT